MRHDAEAPGREASLINVEVLDLGPLYEQAVAHFIAQDPARSQWDPSKCRRLKIRTECRWGRVEMDDNVIYVLNEKGEGEKFPVAGQVRAQVALYAEMDPVPGDAGFFDLKPFCQVALDREAVRSFKSLGLVALEDFVRERIPEMEAAYLTWLEVLRAARNRTKPVRLKVGV